MTNDNRNSKTIRGIMILARGALMAGLFLVLASALSNMPIAGSPRAATPPTPRAQEKGFSSAELNKFARLEAIDTHAHVFVVDPAFTEMLKTLHMHLLDICVVHSMVSGKELSKQVQEAEAFVKSGDGHAALCATFNPYPAMQPGFAHDAIQQLNQNFDEGAIAVKIWKNVGMEIKDAQGHFLMPDNPVFEPIYQDIASHGKTLVAHLAEPDSCWNPPNLSSPDYSYYKEHPEWYMYGKPGAPTKGEILSARDHVLNENPTLRVVGAHLGSMESNLDELGKRFDRYPNFATDMAARMPYVMMAPRDKAIAFVSRYQDRLIYGTDLDYRAAENSKETIGHWEGYYARDWRFLATKDWVEYMGKKYQGLDLPQSVLEKIYHSNAVHWFPGILGN